MFGNWRERGESDFTAGADGYLQGLLITQQSQRAYVVGTDRRVAMLQGVSIKRDGDLAAKSVPHSFRWEQVRSYYIDDEMFALRVDDPEGVLAGGGHRPGRAEVRRLGRRVRLARRTPGGLRRSLVHLPHVKRPWFSAAPMRVAALA